MEKQLKKEIKKGSNYEVFIKKSEHSLTLGGKEGFGKSLGIFKISKINSDSVETEDRIFYKWHFDFLKVGC
jgi:hypothetical protein